MKNTKKSPERPAKPKITKKAPKSAGKRPRSGVKRRKKPAASDAVRAVILAGVLIAVSGFISMAVIVVHSTINRPASGGMAVIPAAERPVPESAVSENPAEKPVPAVSAPAKPVEKPVPAGIPPPVEKPAPIVSAPPPARPDPVQPPGRPAPSSPPVPAAGTTAPPERAAPPEQPKPEHRGTLVFVIDDAGNNLRELEPFLRFPGSLTIAVLPGLPHSAEAARRIRAAGKEVFLHQPMEAVGGQAPGPGAIYSGMSADEIRAVLRRNTAEIGPIAGMNNHQGSKITMDREAMETVLAFCREQGLYFLDSRTIAETAAPAAAKRLGMKIGERDVFIDNEQEKSSMIRYIREGAGRAEQRGSAVMIGHTWSPELAPLLTELYPGLLSQGYSLSTASALISGRAE
ncbi:MAG: divergent polysaccharide deacetylase family protein [Treponema sp.]|nr:divergent polysaccharide deacetylase family protein [Treponema sp.]